MYSSEHTISGTDKEAGPSDFSQPEKDYRKWLEWDSLEKSMESSLLNLFLPSD